MLNVSPYKILYIESFKPVIDSQPTRHAQPALSNLRCFRFYRFCQNRNNFGGPQVKSKLMCSISSAPTPIPTSVGPKTNSGSS